MRCREPNTNLPSLRVRIRIPRSLPQAVAIERASPGISPRAMIVLRVGSFGDKLSSIVTFWGWTKMMLRSEWLKLIGFEIG